MNAEVEAAVAEAHRREWGFVLAATLRVTREIDLAEECVQDAYARALATWSERGVPAKPGAWLTTVARRRAIDLQRRRAIDLQRRRATQHRALPLLVEPTLAGESGDSEVGEIPDERL